MLAERTIQTRSDLYLGSAVSVGVHLALAMLIGLSLTQMPSVVTPLALKSLRLDLNLSSTLPDTDIVSAPSSSPANVLAAPMSTAIPRPAATPQTKESSRPPVISQTDASSVSAIETLDAAAWPGKRMFGTGGTVTAAGMNATGSGAPATGSVAEGVGLEGPVAFSQFTKPAYPLGARQRGEEGRVVLEVQVAPDGHPERVTLFNSSGFSELDRAAVRAIERALFTPATANGQPIEAQAHITILFRLTN